MRSILFFILCFPGIVIAQRTAKEEIPILFTLNKKPVYTDEFIYLYKKNHQTQPDAFTAENINDYLNLFINFKLKVEEARQRGLDQSPKFQQEYNSYREELRKPYLPDAQLTDSLVRMTYNRLQQEVRAAHILIMLKQEATPADTLAAYNRAIDIKQRAQRGEDFGELASTLSEDPSAKTNKGDLGYFTAMQMVYPFESAAYTGKIGEVVGPVRTRFGYHIIKIIDRKPARGEVEVSHIMIRTSDPNDMRAKNVIFEVYDQLKGDVSWDDLCKQYSEDQNTKNSGGRLRPFGVGAMNAVPEFDRVAFSLENPGDISDPFQTMYGWHIVRLEKKIALPPYETLAQSLTTRVLRDERAQLSRKATQAKVKRDLKFTENETIKQKVMALADSSLTTGKWNIPTWATAKKDVLLRINNNDFTVQSFFEFITQNQVPNNQQPERYMQQLYDLFAERNLNEQLELAIRKKHPEFDMLLREYYEGILLFDVMEREVWNRAVEDSVGQRKFFESHQDNYQASERIAATIYTTSTESIFDELVAIVQLGDSVKLAEFMDINKIRSESGRYQREDRPFLEKIPWQPGMHQSRHGGMYYLADVSAVVPAGRMTLNEARTRVISDYQEYLEKTWLEILRKKYRVKLNEKSKTYCIEKLTAK